MKLDQTVRQEDGEFKSILGYRVSSISARGSSLNPYVRSKQIKSGKCVSQWSCWLGKSKALGLVSDTDKINKKCFSTWHCLCRTAPKEDMGRLPVLKSQWVSCKDIISLSCKQRLPSCSLTHWPLDADPFVCSAALSFHHTGNSCHC